MEGQECWGEELEDLIKEELLALKEPVVETLDFSSVLRFLWEEGHWRLVASAFLSLP